MASVALCKENILSGILTSTERLMCSKKPRGKCFFYFLLSFGSLTYRKVHSGKKWDTLQILMVSVIVPLAWSTLPLLLCVHRLVESWAADTLMTSVKILLSSSFLVPIKHLELSIEARGEVFLQMWSVLMWPWRNRNDLDRGNFCQWTWSTLHCQK